MCQPFGNWKIRCRDRHGSRQAARDVSGETGSGECCDGVMRQRLFEHVGQQAGGGAVDALGAGDDGRILRKIRTELPRGLDLRLRRHGEQHDLGTGNHLRIGTEIQSFR